MPILAIPIAFEGQPITSEYHNSTRTAILAIASQLGISVIGQTVTRTFAPTFYPNRAEPPWQQAIGYAERPPAAASALGWFPIQLPDDVQLQGMTVIGRRTGTTRSFQVSLLRQTLAEYTNNDRVDLLSVPLITLDLSQVQDDFKVSAPVSIPGLSAGAIEEFKQIDNTKFKYLIQASISDASDDATVRINAVQVLSQRV